MARAPQDSFEFILADTMTISVLYESIIVVWKEKVRHDLVRPTSLIQALRAGELVRTYAGPVVGGAAEIDAAEWEPYVRVMPHAEYPSGSACVCKAYQRALTKLEGSDSVLSTIGGPLAVEIPAGSSKTEPGKTPASPLLLTYSSWSQAASRCSHSRLEGGMHFTTSVPAGEDLCAGIGDLMADVFMKLRAGQVPDTVADIYGQPSEVRCPGDARQPAQGGVLCPPGCVSAGRMRLLFGGFGKCPPGCVRST